MSPTAAPEKFEEHWTPELPHVQAALEYLRRGGVKGRTAEEMMLWDWKHGQKLFDWDDTSAAAAHRLYQARAFMNRFRYLFDGFRVRAHIFVRDDPSKNIDGSAYRTVEVIAAHKGMREQIINDVSKRMERLAAELAMWELSPTEQRALFVRLRTAMGMS